MMRHAAVWMGLVKFAAADVIAGRGEEAKETVGAVGREEFKESEIWRLSRFNLLSIGSVGSLNVFELRIEGGMGIEDGDGGSSGGKKRGKKHLLRPHFPFSRIFLQHHSTCNIFYLSGFHLCL